MSTVASEHRTVEFTAKALCSNLACPESGGKPFEFPVVMTVVDERFATYIPPMVRCMKCAWVCYVDGYPFGDKDKRL